MVELIWEERFKKIYKKWSNQHPELKALSSAGKDAMSEECAKNSNPAPGQNLQPHKHHPALTFAIQTWLNMTPSIPADKPLPVPGPVPHFCEL